MMPINTIIFDLDGTLLYTLEDLTDSVNFVLKKFDYPIRTINEVRNFVGNGVGVLIERVIPFGLENKDYESCLSEFKNYYSNNMFNKTMPYDGILEMLNSLKSKNYKVAVLSSKFDTAVKTLCDKYFKGLVDISVGQSDSIPSKPSPEGVKYICESLDSTIEECIFVGDSEVDIQTAINSGIHCVSVSWGYKDIDFLYNNGAETLIYSPEELSDIV